MTIYHMINWFFAFSFIGYCLECVVLTVENRRPYGIGDLGTDRFV